MSIALYEYPVEPSTDEAVLGRRDLYYNAFPRVDYELEIDPQAMERVRPEWFTTHGSVTRQAGHAETVAVEAHVARQLVRVVSDWVDHRVLSQMRGIEDVSRRATRELVQLRDGLVQAICSRGRQRRWFDVGIDFERIECRAEVTPQVLAHAAMQWNLSQPHHRERYERHVQDGWRRGRDPWYAQETPGWQYAGWQYPQMGNQWADYTTFGDTAAWLTTELQNANAQMMNVAYTAGTAASAMTHFNAVWTNSTTGGGYIAADVADTPERRLARQRADEVAKRRAAKRARERDAAEKRGRKLLLELLDEEQTREYAGTSTFKVTAADGRVFRLRKGRTAELLDDANVATASYCIHLYADADGRSFVHEDTMISQMLLLQTDVAEFERIANITPLVYRSNFQETLQRRVPVVARETAQELRYRDMHIRESEAILRAEGIENPRQWMDDIRRQAAAAYRGGDRIDAEFVNTPRGEVARQIVVEEIHNVDAQAERMGVLDRMIADLDEIAAA